MKIVLDTNVIVSALLCPQSLPAKILGLLLNGTIGIVYDNNVLVEYIDVLNREKFKINKELIKIVLDFLVSDGEYIVSIPQNARFTDEDDRIFYELYKSSEADFLITGNIKHFPKERNIITPREFIELKNN
ncbi:MAG: putative toxin-antitoxin system toxin component, PIN family [Treponema sp.]|jgi:putative PIN family toxin of toxin-antitoxin system|nr:putative toxin-antitoxin system toxin component, PIN family [Treponema sp.]